MLLQKLWQGLFTPLLLISVLTGCARAQGATAPTGVFNGTSDTSNLVGSALEIDRNNSFLPQVEAAAIEPIINYVDSLNWALAGDLSKLKKAAHPECGCLDISQRLKKLFTTSALIGGSYQLEKITLKLDSERKKSFDVVIHRSDLIKIEKSGGRSQVWSASVISNQFVVEKIQGLWQLTQVI